MCFLGDELIRETELQQYNASEDHGVLYILTSNPVRCTGRVTTVETCVYVTYPDETTEESNSSFKSFVSVFRYNNLTSIYTQLFSPRTLWLQESDVDNTTQTYCFQISIPPSRGWLVQEDDVLGVYVPSSTVTQTQKIYPIQPVIKPSQTRTNVDVLYVVTSDANGNVARFRLNTSQAIVNIRASVGKINTCNQQSRVDIVWGDCFVGGWDGERATL